MDPRLKNTKRNYETKRTQEKFCATLLWAKISSLEHKKKAMEWEKTYKELLDRHHHHHYYYYHLK